jgi:hypothetical protein
MVRGDRLREEEIRRIAVALVVIAQDLIVGAILFDDVDDVLERRVAMSARTGFPRIGSGDAAC